MASFTVTSLAERVVAAGPGPVEGAVEVLIGHVKPAGAPRGWELFDWLKQVAGEVESAVCGHVFKDVSKNGPCSLLPPPLSPSPLPTSPLVYPPFQSPCLSCREKSHTTVATAKLIHPASCVKHASVQATMLATR
jgi:hypothetical protein